MTEDENSTVTPEMILKELAIIGFSNASDFIQLKDGAICLTQYDQLTEEQKKVIAGYKEGRYGVELKLHDKMQALQLMGRYLGMFSGKSGTAEPESDDSFLDALRKQAEEVWE